MTMQLMNRTIKVFIPIIVGMLTIFLAIAYFLMIWMPGTSYQGTLLTLSSAEEQLRNALRSDVEMLSGTIGQRNSLNYAGIKKAAEFLEAELNTAGYTVNHNRYQIDGKDYDNLEVEIKGIDRPDQIILIGAHYDSVPFSPGDRKSTRLNSSHPSISRMPSSA